MNRITVCAALAALTALCMSGCSGSDSSSVKDENSNVTSTDVQSSAPVSSEALGEKLKSVADIYDSGSYTLECTLTGTDIDGAVKIKRVVSGDDCYQLQTERLGSHGYVTVGGRSYDFDYVCGMYRAAELEPELNIIDKIRQLGLSPTVSRITDGEYDTEQYTYTGETYITVMDFFFDKADGHLVKYVTTYTVEGRDDIVETRTVDLLERGADESLLNAYFADDLVEFDALSEEEKLGFCRGLCASWGITAEELFDMGISSTDLKTVDYETLARLIHTYGKPHDNPDSSSSEALDESSGESSSDTSGESTPEESLPESSKSDDTLPDESSESETDSESADTSAE